MPWRRGLLVALAVLAVGWLGAAVLSGGRTTGTEYRGQAVQAATGALGAVRTARLAGTAQLDGRSVDKYTTTMLDDALADLSDAQQRLAAEPPPTGAGTRLRDQLVPLLTDADRRIGDLSRALDDGDDALVRAAVDALGPLGDRLDEFVRHNS